MATEIDAARLLTERAAAAKDAGQTVTRFSAQAKLYASEIAVRATDRAIQIHGGYGFTKDFPVEKFYRDVKLCTIGEGTSEIQKLVIAKQLLSGGRMTAARPRPRRPRSSPEESSPGRPRPIGRAISEVERDSGDGARDPAPRSSARTGRARIVGITGPPGAGKSTLVQRLAQAYRRRGRARSAIVAVDPSSPFTGGAILGDRIRMAEIYTDPGVFIRSMATRGALGGLARATSDAVDVLDAAGFEVILIETVGVGQDEVDIVRAADTTAVVLVPGLGDDIQAIKAGHPRDRRRLRRQQGRARGRRPRRRGARR